jgi:branched-chain amino acid transport system permease protein
MNFLIFGFLIQNALTTGAIYVLISLTLVSVATVTRIIYVPIGEIMVFAPFGLSLLMNGQVPGTVWLLMMLGGLAFLQDVWQMTRTRSRHGWRKAVLLYLVMPVLVAVFSAASTGPNVPFVIKLVAACAAPVALNPVLFRVAFQPLASATRLVLLIAAIALHFALAGAGLYMFGPDGLRTPGLTGVAFRIGLIPINDQFLLILGACLALIAGMYGFFEYTLYGKALRATAIHRRGARLVGIDPDSASQVIFTIAGVVAVISGLLIGPLTTLFYDSGFLLGLKGFAGAILGGLADYPMAALGALALAGLESFSAFYASEYKDVIVFAALIPILLYRSWRQPAQLEEEHFE